MQLTVVSSSSECSGAREAAVGGVVRGYLEGQRGALVSSVISSCTTLPGVRRGGGKGGGGGFRGFSGVRF